MSFALLMFFSQSEPPNSVTVTLFTVSEVMQWGMMPKGIGKKIVNQKLTFLCNKMVAFSVRVRPRGVEALDAADGAESVLSFPSVEP